jgi:hypothetical protein
LSGEEKGLISYVDEMAIYGLRSNQIDVVVPKDVNSLPGNHISNISPTNNFPMSTPNLKLDENGNIIPDDTFLKSNPFLIPNNIQKKAEKKENPNQYPTIIVTLPNEAILPYSPKIPMDIYYREGWVDYSNPDSSRKNNTYNPREMNKKREYDFKYLAPLIPKNHFSLKLKQSFITKLKVQEEINKTNNKVVDENNEKQQDTVLNNKETLPLKEEEIIENKSLEKSHLIGNYYINGCINELAEEYELVNHAFWWQEDCNQQAIAV